MKRSFSEVELDSVTMANCLMLLAKGREASLPNSFHAMINASTDRVFECKTCNRQFPSFQALGGHRASHKKPRLMTEGDGGGGIESQSSPTKPKTHECSICGQEFSIGQALGGHMRRHRAALSDDDHHHHHHQRLLQAPPPVVKKSNSRRVLCLDLNLTPLENDLEFLKLGRNKDAPPPMVDCFL